MMGILLIIFGIIAAYGIVLFLLNLFAAVVIVIGEFIGRKNNKGSLYSRNYDFDDD